MPVDRQGRERGMARQHSFDRLQSRRHLGLVQRALAMHRSVAAREQQPVALAQRHGERFGEAD